MLLRIGYCYSVSAIVTPYSLLLFRIGYYCYMSAIVTTYRLLLPIQRKRMLSPAGRRHLVSRAKLATIAHLRSAELPIPSPWRVSDINDGSILKTPVDYNLRASWKCVLRCSKVKQDVFLRNAEPPGYTEVILIIAQCWTFFSGNRSSIRAPGLPSILSSPLLPSPWFKWLGADAWQSTACGHSHWSMG